MRVTRQLGTSEVAGHWELWLTSVSGLSLKASAGSLRLVAARSNLRCGPMV